MSTRADHAASLTHLLCANATGPPAPRRSLSGTRSPRLLAGPARTTGEERPGAGGEVEALRPPARSPLFAGASNRHHLPKVGRPAPLFLPGRIAEPVRAPGAIAKSMPEVNCRKSSFRTRVWRPATRAAGLKGLRIHDLRHSAVALWIAAGVSPKVATRAGRTSVSFTLDRYGICARRRIWRYGDRPDRFPGDQRPGGNRRMKSAVRRIFTISSSRAEPLVGTGHAFTASFSHQNLWAKSRVPAFVAAHDPTALSPQSLGTVEIRPIPRGGTNWRSPLAARASGVAAGGVQPKRP
jgi:hypothetical protein